MPPRFPQISLRTPQNYFIQKHKHELQRYIDKPSTVDLPGKSWIRSNPNHSKKLRKQPTVERTLRRRRAHRDDEEDSAMAHGPPHPEESLLAANLEPRGGGFLSHL
jgi:hypothetical protein